MKTNMGRIENEFKLILIKLIVCQLRTDKSGLVSNSPYSRDTGVDDTNFKIAKQSKESRVHILKKLGISPKYIETRSLMGIEDIKFLLNDINESLLNIKPSLICNHLKIPSSKYGQFINQKLQPYDMHHWGGQSTNRDIGSYFEYLTSQITSAVSEGNSYRHPESPFLVCQVDMVITHQETESQTQQCFDEEKLKKLTGASVYKETDTWQSSCSEKNENLEYVEVKSTSDPTIFDANVDKIKLPAIYYQLQVIMHCLNIKQMSLIRYLYEYRELTNQEKQTLEVEQNIMSITPEQINQQNYGDLIKRIKVISVKKTVVKKCNDDFGVRLQIQQYVSYLKKVFKCYFDYDIKHANAKIIRDSISDLWNRYKQIDKTLKVAPTTKRNCVYGIGNFKGFQKNILVEHYISKGSISFKFDLCRVVLKVIKEMRDKFYGFEIKKTKLEFSVNFEIFGDFMTGNTQKKRIQQLNNILSLLDHSLELDSKTEIDSDVEYRANSRFQKYIQKEKEEDDEYENLQRQKLYSENEIQEKQIETEKRKIAKDKEEIEKNELEVAKEEKRKEKKRKKKILWKQFEQAKLARKLKKDKLRLEFGQLMTDKQTKRIDQENKIKERNRQKQDRNNKVYKKKKIRKTNNFIGERNKFVDSEWEEKDYSQYAEDKTDIVQWKKQLDKNEFKKSKVQKNDITERAKGMKNLQQMMTKQDKKKKVSRKKKIVKKKTRTRQQNKKTSACLPNSKEVRKDAKKQQINDYQRY